MLRLYDWQCGACQTVHEELVESPAPSHHMLDCPTCEAETAHARILSVPPPYTGEKPRSPRISGGSYDTMGYEQPKLAEPDLPKKRKGDTWNHHSDQLDNHFRSPEYRAYTAELSAVTERNRPKQERAKAGVDFRSNPLPGDPKL